MVKPLSYIIKNFAAVATKNFNYLQLKIFFIQNHFPFLKK